jgi:hypothetical protein
VCNSGYKWEMHVVLYEKTRGTREHRIRQVHHASTTKATFEAGIHDAAHPELMVLCHQELATL